MPDTTSQLQESYEDEVDEVRALPLSSSRELITLWPDSVTNRMGSASGTQGRPCRQEVPPTTSKESSATLSLAALSSLSMISCDSLISTSAVSCATSCATSLRDLSFVPVLKKEVVDGIEHQEDAHGISAPPKGEISSVNEHVTADRQLLLGRFLFSPLIVRFQLFVENPSRTARARKTPSTWGSQTDTAEM